MNTFSQDAFDQFILRHTIIGFQEEMISFKYGRQSHCYVNWRRALGSVGLLDELSDFLLSFLARKNISFDALYGVPEGVTALGVLSQYKSAKAKNDLSLSIGVGRKQPKEHGAPEDRFFVSAPKGKTVIIEDVTTTGGSLLKTIDSLKQAGVSLACAVTLTNRNELTAEGISVPEAVARTGVQYFAMSNLLELLPLLIAQRKPEQKYIDHVKEYFSHYGVKPLTID